MELINVGKTYGKDQVLSYVNLGIQKGKITGLIGKNGAGKTTLMKIICQIVQRYQGNLKQDNSTVGYLIEHPKAYNHQSGWYNIKYFSNVYGVYDPDYIDYLLESLEMKSFIHKKVRKYSMGMKQRLGIVLSLLQKPDYLILDEPTNGMDPDSSLEVLETLQKLAREFQMGVLLSSHKLEDIEMISDDIMFINQGKIDSHIEVNQLNQSGVIAITVKDEDTADALVIAETTFGTADKDENTVRIPYTQDISSLLREYATSNIFPEQISTETQSLKDYYFNLTKTHGGVVQ